MRKVIICFLTALLALSSGILTPQEETVIATFRHVAVSQMHPVETTSWIELKEAIVNERSNEENIHSNHVLRRSHYEEY